MSDVFRKFQWEIKVLFPFHVGQENADAALLKLSAEGFTIGVMPDLLILWEDSSHKDVAGLSDGMSNNLYPTIPSNETIILEHEGVKFCEVRLLE
jgi:hypothetical protein